MLHVDPLSGVRYTLSRSRRAVVLIGLLIMQAVCIAYFLFDAMADILGLVWPFGDNSHLVIELIAVLVLILGTALTTVEIRRIMTRQRRVEAQLRVASGAFLDLVDEHFDAWALTPSERDVALLAIKGLSISEIARVRNTKEGTVKAQSNAIYSKAGVSGRSQLLSLFIDELISDRLLPAGTTSAPPAEPAPQTT